MNNPNSCCERAAGCVLSLLRIVVAILFMCHGGQKLFGYPATAHSGTPELFSLIGISGLLEFFGGLFILIGLFTRPVAFILACEMAVAYVKVHAVQSWSPFQLNDFWPIHNHGELAILYGVVFLYLAAAGGGAFSVDSCWKRCREKKNAEATAPTQP